MIAKYMPELYTKLFDRKQCRSCGIRITSTSVISVTGVWPYFDISCWTNLPDGLYDRVYVTCNKNIPNGFAINYAIFNNPAYG